jgi:hypothetical protein
VLCESSRPESCESQKLDAVDVLPFMAASETKVSEKGQLLVISKTGDLSVCRVFPAGLRRELFCTPIAGQEVVGRTPLSNLTADYFKLSDGSIEYDCERLPGKPLTCAGVEQSRSSTEAPLLFGRFSDANAGLEVLRIDSRISRICSVANRGACISVAGTHPLGTDAIRSVLAKSGVQSVVVGFSQNIRTVCTLSRANRWSWACTNEQLSLSLDLAVPFVSTPNEPRRGQTIVFAVAKKVLASQTNLESAARTVTARSAAVAEGGRETNRHIAQSRTAGSTVPSPMVSAARVGGGGIEQDDDGIDNQLTFGPTQFTAYWGSEVYSFWTTQQYWLWEMDSQRRSCVDVRLDCDVNHMWDTSSCNGLSAALGWETLIGGGSVGLILTGGAGAVAFGTIVAAGASVAAITRDYCMSAADRRRAGCYRTPCN